MKKIIIILINCIAIISCTKSTSNEDNNVIPKELLGKWKLVGYYDDQANEPDGTNYHPLTSQATTSYNSNGTFEFYDDINNITSTGIFSVASDLVISHTITSSTLEGEFDNFSQNKIVSLSSDFAEFASVSTSTYTEIGRYEKILTP